MTRIRGTGSHWGRHRENAEARRTAEALACRPLPRFRACSAVPRCDVNFSRYRTRTFFACLLGSFLIVTQVAQAAAAVCGSGDSHACCCAQPNPESPCAMGCTQSQQLPAVTLSSPATGRVFHLPAVLGVGPEVALPATSVRARSSRVGHLARHDSPRRRYLLVCNFRL